MRVLGLDFGERFVGLAVGEGEVVSPLPPVESPNWEVVVTEVSKAVAMYNPEQVILGNPQSSTGGPTPQSQLVGKFCRLLQKRLRIPVILVNEFGTSKEALNEAVELGAPQRSRKHLDSLAAAILTRRYLLESKTHETN